MRNFTKLRELQFRLLNAEHQVLIAPNAFKPAYEKIVERLKVEIKQEYEEIWSQ